MRKITLLILGAVLAYLAFRGMRREAATPPAFMGSESCRECHQEEYDKWKGSHHDLAMQHATPETVLGDFGDAEFEHQGTSYRFERDGELFRVRIGDRTYPVPYTFGVHPLQQYLLDCGDGRLQALPVAWDVPAKQWFAWYEEAFELDEPRFNWNHMCADCHSTGYRKNFKDGVFAYSYEEVNIGCEACHGPCEEHNADPTVKTMTVQCAPCHSRRAQMDDFRHGAGYHELHDLALITEPLYYPDGQIRDEVYVWGSFLQSKMHNAGVTCMDCHDPHSARLLREGNELCTECHRADPPERFPTLKKRDYETFEHHGHQPGTEGSLCIECHMASRTYMGNDVRHDHSFRIPRPDLSVTIGVPNACTGCHLDRPPEWAAEAARGMGDGVAAETPHFGTVFATNDLDGLIRIAFGEAAPEIVRASAVFRLRGHADPKARQAIEEAAEDMSALIRLAAVRAGARDVKRLIEDPVGSVAVNAAQTAGIMTDRLRRRFEYLADRAEGPFNRAIVHEKNDEPEEAERQYRAALAIDPRFLPARFNLGNLLARIGRSGAAEQEFEKILEIDPDNGEAHYSLALLLVELKRPNDALPHLREAARMRPRALYNLGLLLQQLGKPEEGRAALEEAHRRIPRDNDVIYALAFLHARRGEREEALRYVRILAERGDPRASGFR
ncbi:MAG: tetratricopeptide repeat protein [Planctomycetota bacterium]|jgi:predicted CXXCH cytochrome family protein